MEKVLIFKGKYGATEQYAQWLGEALHIPIYDCEASFAEDLAAANVVLVGSSVYMGKLLIADWLKQHMDILKTKRLFLFIVCATTPDETDKRKQIIANNVPAELAKDDTVFFLPGRVIIKKLSWKDRLFVKLGSLLEKDPVKRNAMVRGIDGVKKENLDEIIQEVLKYSRNEFINDEFLPVNGR